MPTRLDTYQEVHRYDGAAMQRARVDVVVPCAVQPRDVAILRDVCRYKFLTAAQVLELWWPGRSDRAGQRRLRVLFDAGYLERFRPVTRRGSFPWTYQLAADGHRLLQRAGVIAHGERFNPRSIYDYGHVLHEIQLNAWVLAYRRAIGSSLMAWDGEANIDPPPEARSPEGVRIGDDWSPEGLVDPRARLVRPDAVLEVECDDGHGPQVVFVEYDRTRRVDKNYEKFRRYDAYLNWWWRYTELRDAGAPVVVFVCQDAVQVELFVKAADSELTGHLWHPGVSPDRYRYIGRRNMMFVRERDAHDGDLRPWRVPEFPREHLGRVANAGRLVLPGAAPAAAEPQQLSLIHDHG
jgi:Replication-relaxation